MQGFNEFNNEFQKACVRLIAAALVLRRNRMNQFCTQQIVSFCECGQFLARPIPVRCGHSNILEDGLCYLEPTATVGDLVAEALQQWKLLSGTRPAAWLRSSTLPKAENHTQRTGSSARCHLSRPRPGATNDFLRPRSSPLHRVSCRPSPNFFATAGADTEEFKQRARVQTLEAADVMLFSVDADDAIRSFTDDTMELNPALAGARTVPSRTGSGSVFWQCVVTEWLNCLVLLMHSVCFFEQVAVASFYSTGCHYSTATTASQPLSTMTLITVGATFRRQLANWKSDRLWSTSMAQPRIPTCDSAWASRLEKWRDANFRRSLLQQGRRLPMRAC